MDFDIKIVTPLAAQPYVDRPVLMQWAQGLGLNVPEAYAMDYSHNNCNKLCVEMGIRQAVLTYKVAPMVYLYWMYMEESLQAYIGTDATILRRQGKDDDPKLSLRELKEMIDAGTVPPRWTTDARSKGCSCFSMPMDFLADVPLIVKEKTHGVITRTA